MDATLRSAGLSAANLYLVHSRVLSLDAPRRCRCTHCHAVEEVEHAVVPARTINGTTGAELDASSRLVSG